MPCFTLLYPTDMGLGKTVQTLGLILSNPPMNHVYGKSRQPLGEVRLQEPVCTLIVCPVSVMSNWVSQIESHVEDGALLTALYAGKKSFALSIAVYCGLF
jgi:SWI/SNF-related matrix-associated actin-dependent regulator of chromatin subfamily A3